MSKKKSAKKPLSVYADYESWLARDRWHYDVLPFLLMGLNPDVLIPLAKAQGLSNRLPAAAPPALSDYQRKYGSIAVLTDSYRDRLAHLMTKPENAAILDSGQTVQPMAFVQMCVDENVEIHHSFEDHLRKTDFSFRFSRHSPVFQEMERHSKHDLWYLPEAARMILGLHPDLSDSALVKAVRLTENRRHANRDRLAEVYEVMDMATESWHVGALLFFSGKQKLAGGEDIAENRDWQRLVQVPARDFVTWAVKKGFRPPEQLLELMEIKTADPAPSHESEAAPQKRRNELHELIGKLVTELRHRTGKFPNADAVWKELKSRQDDFECIESVERESKTGEDVIFWCSQWNNDNRMTRSTFNNIVSQYKTGKKALPLAA